MNILGVNAGNGAVLYAFKKAHKIIGNIERRTDFKTPGNIQWELNFPGIPLYNTGDSLPDLKERVDVIVGHPNCGHSSMLAYSRAKKLSNPKEDKSVTLFQAALRKYKPKSFLFENLPKFLTNYSEKELRLYFKGYRIRIIRDAVSVFGNSQVNRVRLVVIGIREDHQITLWPRRAVNTLKFTNELIGDLKEPNPIFGHFREFIDSDITMYGGYKVKLSEVINLWNGVFKNKSRFEAVGRKYTTAPGVYKNLPNDYPNTVRKGNREFDPTGWPMSPRQRARIQGLPDDFKIWYDESKYTLSLNKGRITVTKCFPYEISLWYLKVLKYIH